MSDNDPNTKDGQAAPSVLTSKFAKLNPFSRTSAADPDGGGDNLGEEVEFDSIAGGGHAARRTKITKSELRISHALRQFLVNENLLSAADASLDDPQATSSDPLKTLVDQSHIEVPDYVRDRSRPLSEYFVSSSHNTYLLAHQLYGSSSAVAYEHVLVTGARCVEIDAWDNEDDPAEPKVTHGYTLASHIPFRAVCETMKQAIQKEEAKAARDGSFKVAPVLLSLENHCGHAGQKRLVEIMHEVWGDLLISGPVEKGEPASEHTSLDHLGAKIAVMVEFHLSNEPPVEKPGEEDDEEETKNKSARNEAKKAGIIPELCALGVYAQSVKPVNSSWYETTLTNGPHDHLINISETGLLDLLPKQAEAIKKHNAEHLMRVYPKGTRISSKNLNPVPFWGVGAQVCALNWQTFDASVQLNEALFSGSDGYVLKPPGLRMGGDGNTSLGKHRLKLHIAGATDLPLPKGKDADDIRPYLSCTLILPTDLEGEPEKRKTKAYKQHKLGIVHKGEQPIPTDPIWHETLEWDFEHDELAFLRIMVKSDDRFARNPMFAVATVRLTYAAQGWKFIRLLDLKGRETHSTLLARFKLERL
ncbi:C2 domain protein [Kalmanozyma brasiliensis GHG001]|uniref:Phosphoinositide phospholipase C n=1 Tax=Kalmanozyma brasiliensis (strain GHG001) TaxID=1365824 RepID=V5ERM7_KALBG|nr:C2 domain protein [Kalmanozyma brasiliensis GHG001]EST07810.1 C2 domain protein [Kalmanozyma brasiliensis GHG001]